MNLISRTFFGVSNVSPSIAAAKPESAIPGESGNKMWTQSFQWKRLRATQKRVVAGHIPNTFNNMLRKTEIRKCSLKKVLRYTKFMLKVQANPNIAFISWWKPHLGQKKNHRKRNEATWWHCKTDSKSNATFNANDKLYGCQMNTEWQDKFFQVQVSMHRTNSTSHLHFFSLMKKMMPCQVWFQVQFQFQQIVWVPNADAIGIDSFNFQNPNTESIHNSSQ